jgi:hypothetical protein
VNPWRRQARFAGFLYLLIGLIAPIGLIVVPGMVIVPRDATATADLLRASGWILRVGIASELIHQVITVFLLLALYRLFKPIDRDQAWLLVVFGGLVSIPIMFLNVVNEIAALILVGGADFLSVFARPQLDALAYFFLRLHTRGITVASIFWGLWLFPLAILVLRSGRSGRWSRVVGVLLVAAGAGYLASAFTSLVVPQYARFVDPVALALEIGELPVIFWLLAGGAKAQSPAAPVTD